MKQQIVLFFIALLLSSFVTSARLLGVCCSPSSTYRLFSMRMEHDIDIGQKEVKANDIALARSSTKVKDDVELMGSEECDGKDEECSSRRMIAEAQLDYIYTQHLKP